MAANDWRIRRLRARTLWPWLVVFALLAGAAILTACSAYQPRPSVGIGYIDRGDFSSQSDRSPLRSESGTLDDRFFEFLIFEPKRGFERDWPYWGNIPLYPSHMPQETGPVDTEVDPDSAGTASGEPESLTETLVNAATKGEEAKPWGQGILFACLGLALLVGIVLWGRAGFPGIRRNGHAKE